MMFQENRKEPAEDGLARGEIKPALEQHFLRSVDEYRALLGKLGLEGRQILELGAGTGVLTEMLLAARPAALRAYEIVPGLCRLEDPRLTLLQEDFTSARYDFLLTGRWCLVANPPYGCLPFILDLIERNGIEDVVLMIPAKKFDRFPGYSIAFTLEGGDFDPPSEGRHHVIFKGFRDNQSRSGRGPQFRDHRSI